MRVPTLAILACSLLGACASTPSPIAQTLPPAASGYVDKATRMPGGLLIGGQPTQADWPALKAAGIRRVINLRTPEEMGTIGYDQAAELQALGISYQTHPVGGNAHPYTPALVEVFDAQMRAGGGDLLLHCASGVRAGQLYAAWLVRYRGYTPEAALRTLEPLGGWPLPLEKLLGRPLRVEWR
ncbi:MAG: hypothetical protein IT479_11875 [Xanthomonadales bacterium]|nr:hypothetical protein [Xanthomonadales bacterium]MCC6593960.1 hypothetical protein [Xanthomonadales bacterium]MCE7930940.1 hypothetical protein [Xanthomonadales bacterium PRO6]